MTPETLDPEIMGDAIEDAEAEPDPRRLFVYGTLRTDLRGSPSERSEGRAILRSHRMHRASGWFPGIVPSDLDDRIVVGEIIDYSDLSDVEWSDRLARFDSYEGVSAGLYRREIVEVEPEDGDPVLAYTYIFNRSTSHMDVVESGDWADVVG